jgi:hypothetical protein
METELINYSILEILQPLRCTPLKPGNVGVSTIQTTLKRRGREFYSVFWLAPTHRKPATGRPSDRQQDT